MCTHALAIPLMFLATGLARSQNGRLTPSQCRAAPREATIAGRALAVEPHASLNLMPGMVMPGDPPPTQGSRFSVGLRITAVDAEPLPPDFDAVHAWICSGGRVWGDTLWAPRPDGDRRSLFRVLRGGAAWLEKLQEADVVLRLVGPGDTTRLLRLVDVRVEVAE